MPANVYAHHAHPWHIWENYNGHDDEWWDFATEEEARAHMQFIKDGWKECGATIIEDDGGNFTYEWKDINGGDSGTVLLYRLVEEKTS